MVAQLRTLQSNLTGGELSPAMYTRTDVVKYQTGAKQLLNFLIRPQGGIRNRGGTKFVGEIADSAVSNWQLPFDIGPGESYVLDFGTNTLRFIRDGAYVLQASTAKAISSVTAANPAVFTSAAHGFVNGDRVYLSGLEALAPDLNERFFTVAAATTNTYTLVRPTGVAVSRLGKPAIGAVGVTTKIYTKATPYTRLNTERLQFAQAQDQMYLLSRDHPPYRLVRVAPDNWTLTLETFQPGISPPTGITASVVSGSGTTPYSYVVSALSADTGEESLPGTQSTVLNDLSIVGGINRVTWTAVAGATRYLVYKEDNGVYGFIGGTEGLTLDDENITADLADTPQQGRNPFVGVGNYPGVGTFFEQRLIVASTKLNPSGVWGSQSANPRNFGVSSPAKANDAITFRIRANRVTQIEALVPTDKLLILTRSGEWVCDGGDREGYLTPTNIVLRQRAYRGSTSVPPVLVGDNVVHVQRGGDAVRDLNLQRDVASTELSLLSKHLLRNKSVVSMAYQQKPDSVVWIVMSDGTLLALTYMLEHDIWGWTPMNMSGGIVEGVTVVEEGGIDGGEDAVYLQVRRTVSGVTRRYIERLSNEEAVTTEDAYHMDCGGVYLSETGADAVVGLDHLEGRTLVALVDGNVVRDIVVADGVATLPNPGTIIALGLGYVSRLVTMDLDIGSVKALGSMLGRSKSITEVLLRVENTRGLFAGHAVDDMALVENRQRAGEDWNEATRLFSGDIEIAPPAQWSTTGELIIEQRDPLPANINGILLTWEFGE
jgi:hypothetical protein